MVKTDGLPPYSELIPGVEIFFHRAHEQASDGSEILLMSPSRLYARKLPSKGFCVRKLACHEILNGSTCACRDPCLR
jgi:hypothetical protein